MVTGTRLSVKLQPITAGLCVLESCQVFLPHNLIPSQNAYSYLRLGREVERESAPVSANS